MGTLFSRMKEKLQRNKKKAVAGGAVLGSSLAMAGSASASTSAPIDFGSNTLDVSISDTITTGFNFANMFNEWTMLVLAVIFVPVIVGFIIWLVRKLPRFANR